MKKLSRIAVLAAAAVSAVPMIASAQVAAIDYGDALTYLETNAGGGMVAIGAVILTLAGLGVAIKWVKATFFG